MYMVHNCVHKPLHHSSNACYNYLRHWTSAKFVFTMHFMNVDFNAKFLVFCKGENNQHMLLCSYRCRHSSIPGPAPTRNSRTKWRVSERQTVKELGTDAVDVLDKTLYQ